LNNIQYLTKHLRGYSIYDVADVKWKDKNWICLSWSVLLFWWAISNPLISE